jgi:hypothetical protein
MEELAEFYILHETIMEVANNLFNIRLFIPKKKAI